MVIIAVACVTMIIIALDAPSLYRQGRYKDLAVFLCLTLLALIVSLLLILDIPLPNPNLGIEKVASFLLNTIKTLWGAK